MVGADLETVVVGVDCETAGDKENSAQYEIRSFVWMHMSRQKTVSFL